MLFQRCVLSCMHATLIISPAHTNYKGAAGKRKMKDCSSTVRRHRKLLLVVVALGVLALVYARYTTLLPGAGWIFLTKNEAQGVCAPPLSRYKAWREGVVTVVRPPLRRDCSKLLQGNVREKNRVDRAVSGWKSSLKLDTLTRNVAKCSWLLKYFQDNLYNSQLELSFPIAFTFVVYDSPEQFLRLFKLLYRPQNAYCIHFDIESAYKDYFKSFAECLPNVMIPAEVIKVTWGHKTLLMAQMNCLKQLVSYREEQREEKKWRYVINLCGKELPLVTTREMVEKLIFMNDTSSVVSWPIPASERHTVKRLQGHSLPYNLTLHKSMTYNALSKSFVYFLLQNSTAIDTYKVFMKTYFPEEHFYATLFHLPGAPGGYNRHIPDKQYFEISHYFWRTNFEELKEPCLGQTVHGICVVNYGDMPRIMKETKNGSLAFFQNKYFMEFDHVAMDCMEERIVKRNMKEYELECLERLRLQEESLATLSTHNSSLYTSS